VVEIVTQVLSVVLKLWFLKNKNLNPLIRAAGKKYHFAKLTQHITLSQELLILRGYVLEVGFMEFYGFNRIFVPILNPIKSVKFHKSYF
jgi:hypothetical protein